tara:strand:- start:38 stop:874 length:837 start_codon:yes stop_codon:yes gene_type:complete
MPFDNLGYHIHYKVLNTKDYGIPQNRERIFIVGIRDDADNNFRFPKEMPLNLKLKDILQDNPNYAKSGLYQPYPRNYKELGLKRKEQLELRKDNVSNTITTSNDQIIKIDDKYYLSDKALDKIKIHNNKLNKKASIFQNQEYIKTHSLYPRSSKTNKGGTGHLSKSDGTSYCLDTGNMQAIEWVADYRYDEGLRIRKNNIIPCLNSSMSINESLSASGTLIKQNKIRRLTPIECERLQGFPDNHTEGVSDTQRYKQCGNSITVNVMEAILKNLLNGHS